MRSPQVLLCAMAVTACAGTEGDILLSTRDAALPDAPLSDASSPDTVGPDARPPGDAATPRPKPDPLATWQIQLSGALDTTVDVRVFTADMSTPLATIRGLHNAGRIVICYFSAGTAENFREDAPRFPAESLGSPLPSYPDERWVDVRNATVRSIMQERLAKVVRSECDGVHPSGLAAFNASTGLGFNRADQLDYNRWLAAEAHARGLSIGLVEGDASLSQDLVADFDWAVVWGCLSANCPPATPFVAAKKAAVLIEFGDQSRSAEVCPRAKELGLSAIIKRNGNLDAFRAGCP